MKNFLFYFLISLFIYSPVVFSKEKEKAPKPKGIKVLSKIWTKALKSGGNKKRYYPEAALPSVDQNRVYIGTHFGRFYALDSSQNGKIIWEIETKGPIASGAAFDEQHVFIGNNEGQVLALNKNNGTQVWESYLGAEILATPTVYNGIIYVVTTSREIYALETTTGKEAWSQYVPGFERKFTMRGNSPVLINQGRIYIGFADGQVVCLAQNDGQVLWSKNLSNFQSTFKDVDATIMIDGSYLYAVGYYGTLAKMNRENGNIVWKRDYTSGADMTQDDETVFVSTQDGELVALRKGSGYRKWELDLNSGTLSSPEIFGNYIVVGSQDSKLFVVDRMNGQVLQTISIASGYQSNAEIIDNKFYFMSNSARVYAFNIAKLSSE